MKNFRTLSSLFCLLCSVLLDSCKTTDKIFNYSPEPHYFTSQSHEIVEHRAQHFVEYRPGDVYVNKKTLYLVSGTGGQGVTWAHWDGKVIKVIPPGTKFTITSVKARFTVSASRVVPYFQVEGIGEENVSVSPFVITKAKQVNEHVGYFYRRDYFRKTE